MLGTVKWFDDEKGFGFISRDDGERDVFVHFSAIKGQEDRRRTLEEGDRVTFEVEQAEKGPKAVEVRVVEERHGVQTARL